MIRDPLLLLHRDALLQAAHNNGVTSVEVFGSRARGDARPDSDVDFLVELEKPGLTYLAGFLVDAEEILGCKVDVVKKSAIHPMLRESILESAVPL